MSEAFAEPFDAILELGGESLRKAMADVETRLREITALETYALATIEAGGKRLRPLLVFVAGLGSDSHVALCRRAVAARAGNDLCAGRPARRYLDRGPAVLECVCRAGEERGHRAAERALRRLFGARARRVDATRRRLAERCDARALPRALRDEDRADLGPFGHAVGLAFQILDDVLDIIGPAERTGKRRGADLLDGTVTLPLILARETSPELAALDLRAVSGPDEADRICELIEATGAAERARERALELVASTKRSLPPQAGADQRRALELLADGLVQRYA